MHGLPCGAKGILEMDQEKLAAEIYDIVGAAANIKKINNCMTRLRLYLVQQDAEMTAKLKKAEGVLGLNENGEELQIILGPGRAKAVSDGVRKLYARDKAPVDDAAAVQNAKIGDGRELHAAIRRKNATPFKLLLKRVASIFLPLRTSTAST